MEKSLIDWCEQVELYHWHRSGNGVLIAERADEGPQVICGQRIASIPVTLFEYVNTIEEARAWLSIDCSDCEDMLGSECPTCGYEYVTPALWEHQGTCH